MERTHIRGLTHPADAFVQGRNRRHEPMPAAGLIIMLRGEIESQETETAARVRICGIGDASPQSRPESNKMHKAMIVKASEWPEGENQRCLT